MKHTHGKAGKKVGAVLLVLTLALVAIGPMMTQAQAADATGSATMPQGGGNQQGPGGNQQGPGGNQQGPGNNQQGAGNGMPQARGGDWNMTVDTSSMTEEQKAVYDKALALYREIEDAVLADLVTAGSVTQADADAYKLMRDAAAELKALDTSAWTAAQLKAYYEALQLTGDARKAALQALADAGQISQAVANALSGDQATNLWQTLQKNNGSDAAVKTALNTLAMARNAYESTLRDVGIMPAMQNGGRGGNSPQGNNPPPQNNSGNDDGNNSGNDGEDDGGEDD